MKFSVFFKAGWSGPCLLSEPFLLMHGVKSTVKNKGEQKTGLHRSGEMFFRVKKMFLAVLEACNMAQHLQYGV